MDAKFGYVFSIRYKTIKIWIITRSYGPSLLIFYPQKEMLYTLHSVFIVIQSDSEFMQPEIQLLRDNLTEISPSVNMNTFAFILVIHIQFNCVSI